MSAPPDTIGHPDATAPAARARGRSLRVVGALSISETVSWGILYYSFAVFLGPIADTLGASDTAVSGALTVAVLASAAVGILVGRHLDRRAPRLLMTAGSIAGVALVLAWSQVDSMLALYAVFAGIGVVMAAVLYEAAFIVLAKQFADTGRRRQAMTAMTLVAALASFIFVPLAQQLLDAHGWRDALVILAAILAITIPLHAQLPGGRTERAGGARESPRRPGAVRAIVSRRDFQRLTAAYFLATIAGLALLVELLPMLVDRGYSTGFAAFALGTLGLAQIPGRLLFALAGRWLRDGRATPVTFALIAAGLLVLLIAPSAPLVLAGVLLLGMGNGMAILSRATVLAERFGTADYGTVASLTASTTTVARAAGPLIATSLSALIGVDLLIVALIVAALLAIGLTATRAAGSAAPQHALSD